VEGFYIALLSFLKRPAIFTCRTRGVKQKGVRAGNWLVKEQANELLNAPDSFTRKASAIAPS
jgi:hypothetical protein